MKIMFSTDAIKYPLTGVCRYALELLKQLQQSSAISELKYFNNLKVVDALPDHADKALPSSPLKEWLKKRATLIEVYQHLYPLMQKRALRDYRDYIYHSPNYYLPAGLDRAVTTFHDISIFTCPQYHPRERVRYMHKAMQASLKRASRVITVSDFSKHELANYFNYPSEKIDTTYLACSAEFYPRESAQLQPLLTRLGLTEQGYTLFTGTIEPRKNIATLLTAYERLPQEVRMRYPLVLCGYQGWGSEEVHRRFERGQRQGWLHYLGYLPNHDLPLLFAAARVFAFPSLYEGFGLPVLEAMASGVPVVCSNAASLPEVAGDAASMFDPLDVDALTLALGTSLEDEHQRASAIAAGLARARQFSWQRCAAETIEAYRKV
ncbi:glycosyltransferase family 4 protein [Sodalis sp. RH23]|uniref:glycosyltransferase family 4 protein n=1 Tax=unclassified Sodalis (in: enterobacteria) TaxID=2636512 RepID=UPI0039B3FA9B